MGSWLVKPSEEQEEIVDIEEINKMAKEEVHQTTRWGEGGGRELFH